MIIQTNWHVITGAPSSGKTTLIDSLAQEGYTIAKEIARDYIEYWLAQNYTLDRIQANNQQLQRGILARALKRERQLERNKLIFFDRGTADSLGYFNYYQLETKKVRQVCGYKRYKKVFYCQQLPVVPDNVRIEDNSTAPQIGSFIYQAYKELGYQLIELPPVTVEERIKIIITQLGKS